MPVTQEELARRLRAARDACGMTQEHVAELLGVSRPTIVQLELGKRGVTGIELDKLAHLYGRDVRDFLAEEFRADDALSVLFRSELEAGVREPAMEALRDCLKVGREITNLERMVGVDRSGAALPEYGIAAPRSRWDAIQQADRVATAERRRLGLGSGPLPNIAELLESQAVRTAQVSLPDDVSGLTVVAPELGALVVANREHGFLRRRFSYAHEYCHALLDKAQRAAISRTEERDNVLEVRANAFAACFLMPSEGVQEFIEGLSKGKPSRLRADVFDEDSALHAEGRPEPGSQSIQMYDVVLLAHHFRVSRIAALYRLKNLRLVTEPEFDLLREQNDSGAAQAVAKLMNVPEDNEDVTRWEFTRRFLTLALEAFRREHISRRKLAELADMVDIPREDLDHVLTETGLDKPEEVHDVLAPEL